MNIYTIYSESHKELFNIFRDSLMKIDLQDTAMIPRKAPQVCSGDYNSEGSIDFWRINIEYFLELCETNTEPFLYCDCDIIVKKDFTKDLPIRLRGKDIVGQLDKYLFGIRPQICTGIMYINPNDRIKRMFEWMLEHLDKYGNDQKALNRYLLFHKVKWSVLPETYYSINFDNGNKVWDGEDLIIKKRDYFMIHLNWTIGVENKLKLLNKIEEKLK